MRRFSFTIFKWNFVRVRGGELSHRKVGKRSHIFWRWNFNFWRMRKLACFRLKVRKELWGIKRAQTWLWTDIRIRWFFVLFRHKLCCYDGCDYANQKSSKEVLVHLPTILELFRQFKRGLASEDIFSARTSRGSFLHVPKTAKLLRITNTFIQFKRIV